jgi:hypothetical protein
MGGSSSAQLNGPDFLTLAALIFQEKSDS